MLHWFLLLNLVGFFISTRPKWSGGNVLYHWGTSFEGASRGDQPLHIFAWFIGSGGHEGVMSLLCLCIRMSHVSTMSRLYEWVMSLPCEGVMSLLCLYYMNESCLYYVKESFLCSVSTIWMSHVSALSRLYEGVMSVLCLVHEWIMSLLNL